MGTPVNKISGPCPIPNACWTGGTFVAPDDSPKFMRVAVSGIINGDNHDPAQPDAPSGGFILDQITATRWQAIHGRYSLSVDIGIIATIMRIVTATPLPFIIFDGDGGACAVSTGNNLNDPTITAWAFGTMRIADVF